MASEGEEVKPRAGIAIWVFDKGADDGGLGW